MTRITTNDRIRFTEGDCHILAHEIHKLTGWPVCAFGARRGKGGTMHAFVRHPSGSYLDVNGLSKPKALKKHWGSLRYQAGKTTWEWLRDDWGGEEQFSGSRRRAKKVALALVENLPTT